MTRLATKERPLLESEVSEKLREAENSLEHALSLMAQCMRPEMAVVIAHEVLDDLARTQTPLRISSATQDRH